MVRVSWLEMDWGIVGEEKTDLVVIRIEGPTWYLRGS